MNDVSAAELGLVACPSCRLLCQHPALPGGGACPRCGARLIPRRPDSLARTGAWLLGAGLLFLPANLLPVMTSSSPLGSRSDTIASGVVKLWTDGAWGLAIIVFTASILVPGLKIAALAGLLLTTRAGSNWRRRERALLHRLLELVGRWSLLDIFVMAALAGALARGPANVRIEPGSLVFAAVVVLTMLASRSFDPRLIWDRPAIAGATAFTTAANHRTGT